ncbi:MAG: ArsC family reductase [Gammaproteobacteria bacterium]|nr:ArsC family reductase [Gammaproteobacteria bacterium]
MKLYGIPNCDTIKKAKKWLEANGVNYEFHDYRKQGVDGNWLQARCEEHGWENVLNRRGTTWRQLDEDTKNNVDAASAIELMQEHPAMIKRPLLGPLSGSTNDTYLLGFKADAYEAALL